MIKNIILYNQVIYSYQNLNSDKIARFKAFVISANKFVNEIREINKQSSFLYNPLFYFNIPEPLNSRILSDLLNPLFCHGQGDLFLSEYLSHIQMEYKNGEQWKVERESENADIVLSAKNPVRIIVIENKVNNAGDRPNQLFRYYQLKIEKQYIKSKDYPERFKIIYLTKNIEKKYSDQTITSSNGMERVPEELIIRQSFEKDIKTILQNCITKLNSENFRMKAFIHFFMEQTIN